MSAWTVSILAFGCIRIGKEAEKSLAPKNGH